MAPNHGTVLSNERGIALLIVLFIVVLLVALIVEFDFTTRTSLTIAGTFRDGVQATYLARSGVRAAQAVLKEDAEQSDVYDAYDEIWATPVPPYPVGNGVVSVEITDESSKLNINLLGDTQGQEKWKAVWERLFRNLEIDTEIVGAIIDWLDDNDQTEGFSGAEASYYERLEVPYTAKNGPMDSLGELRLIRGVTREVTEKLMTGCEGKPCFTIAGTQKININTVSGPVCQALDEDLTENDCDLMIGGRPHENIGGDLDAVGGQWGSNEIRSRLALYGGKIDIKSEYFSVRSKGEVHETIRVVDAIVKRQKTQKPVLERWRVE